MVSHSSRSKANLHMFTHTKQYKTQCAPSCVYTTDTHTPRNTPKITTVLSFPSSGGTDQWSHANTNRYTGEEIPKSGPTFSPLISKLARYVLLVPCGMCCPCQILGSERSEEREKKKLKLCKSHPNCTGSSGRFWTHLPPSWGYGLSNTRFLIEILNLHVAKP